MALDPLQNLISFYRDCYQSDSQAVSINNFFGRQIDQKKTIHDLELLNGQVQEYAVEEVWAKKVQEILTVYKKEKALYCGAIFIQGKTSFLGKTHNICAPLLLFPLELIEKDTIFYLKLKQESSIINPAFVAQLDETKYSSKDDFIQKIPTGVLNFKNIFKIEETLKHFFPEQAISIVSEFPKPIDLKAFKKIVSDESNQKLLPFLGLFISKKSDSSRSILMELEEISKRKIKSPPLQHLFFGLKSKLILSTKKQIFVPANLSNPQERIIHSANQQTNTLVIGPPGTGKSFTIAAIAIDALNKGKSVLIASKKNPALDVIQSKISEDLKSPNIVIRVGKREYKKELYSKLDYILNGIGVRKVDKSKLKLLQKTIQSRQKKIEVIQKKIITLGNFELQFGKNHTGDPLHFFEKIQFFFAAKKWKQKDMGQLIHALKLELHLKNESVLAYGKYFNTQTIFQILSKNRDELFRLKQAIKARTGVKKEAIFKEVDYKLMLQAFPIWMTNANDIHSFIPLKEALFDLVIIDEATQCDVASAIPLLYRAKKAVVVGDPKQLQHFSFLSKKNQNRLATKNKVNDFDAFFLNYRDHSILNMFSAAIHNQEQVHFLDEHYRSVPDIIQFSNTFFYGNALKIMTLTSSHVEKNNLQLHSINGVRNKNGVNQQEFEAIILETRQIIEADRTLSSNFCRSIGILSPFRNQIEYFQKNILKHFNLEEINKHKLLIGTPFSFQGEERDIMFISFTIDGKTHPSAINYLNKEDVFNVSITRARIIQHVFISTSLDTIGPDKLLSKYLSSIQHLQAFSIQKEGGRNVLLDEFSQLVLDKLEQIGVDKIIAPYPIAGTEIDILFIQNGKTKCIDLVGYPGYFQDSYSIAHYKMLFRIDIEIIVISYRQWLKNPDSFFVENSR